MSDDATPDARTRRAYLKHGGTVIGGGLLAGCTGDAESQSTPASGTTETATPAGTTDAPTATAPYTVSMEPMGEVTFESAPER